MRITGGTLSGRRLHTPKSSQIRPMRDQVRAALFNILNQLTDGSKFLDLFAGTGSVGIEALSRGATSAVFVDQSHESIEILENNIAELNLNSRAEIVQADVFSWLANSTSTDEKFDLIFVGPPYYKELADRALQLLSETSLIHSESVIFAEVFKKEILQESYAKLKRYHERLYGDNLINFYQLEETS
jgi:16S rRNA (guanine(966)-N(2))-methyltransferase RsmD